MQSQSITDQQLWTKVSQDDEKAFRTLFDRYYHYVLVTVVNVTGDQTLAKDAAQEVFFELWKKRQQVNIQSDFKSYLRRSVLNRAFNHIKSRSRFTSDDAIVHQVNTDHSVQKELEKEDLQQIINSAIDGLPERCRMVFTLCRLEDMSHKEIAAKMDISTKTVEHQMTKALKILRQAVAPYISKGMSFMLLLEFLS